MPARACLAADSGDADQYPRAGDAAHGSQRRPAATRRGAEAALGLCGCRYAPADLHRDRSVQAGGQPVRGHARQDPLGAAGLAFARPGRGRSGQAGPVHRGGRSVRSGLSASAETTRRRRPSARTERGSASSPPPSRWRWRRSSWSYSTRRGAFPSNNPTRRRLCCERRSRAAACGVRSREAKSGAASRSMVHLPDMSAGIGEITLNGHLFGSPTGDFARQAPEFTPRFMAAIRKPAGQRRRSPQASARRRGLPGHALPDPLGRRRRHATFRPRPRHLDRRHLRRHGCSAPDQVRLRRLRGVRGRRPLRHPDPLPPIALHSAASTSSAGSSGSTCRIGFLACPIRVGQARSRSYARHPRSESALPVRTSTGSPSRSPRSRAIVARRAGGRCFTNANQKSAHSATGANVSATSRYNRPCLEERRQHEPHHRVGAGREPHAREEPHPHRVPAREQRRGAPPSRW